jgi:hypothetical protein
MRDFKFTGDWETELHLDNLTLLQNDRFFEGIYSKKIKEKLVQGLVDIKIFDGFDNNPDPTQEQLSTINFIQENELLLLDKIFDRVKTIVYPFMKTVMDDEERWFPKIETPKDLEKVLGLMSIDILNESKEGYSYFSINFYASWDDEHGFHTLFHKDRIIGTNEAGLFDIQKICEDCGLDYENHTYKFNHWDDNIFEFIVPNPKYGKLKPNQINANEDLPYRLIRNGLEEKLYTHILKGSIDIDYDKHQHSLLAAALQAENLNIINFLIQKKVKNFNGVQYALSRVKNDNIKSIVEKYYLENG